MIRNVLVAIGEMPHEKNAFEYAGHLAVLLDAHLSCVFFQEGGNPGQEDIANRVLEHAEAQLPNMIFWTPMRRLSLESAQR